MESDEFIEEIQSPDGRLEMKQILMDKCTDFLNYSKGEQYENGEYFEGFYIEIEDILDIIFGENNEG